MRSRAGFGLATLALIMGVVACSPSTTESPGTSDVAGTAGPTLDPALAEFTEKLIVGYQSDGRPFVWQEPSGDVVGVDPDLVRECQRRLGFAEPEFVEVGFAGLIPGVQAGRFDFAASAMTYRAERAEAAPPSTPLYNVTTVLIVTEGNPLNIHDYEDLVNSEGNIGVLNGSAPQAILQDDPELAPRLTSYDDTSSQFADLAAGRIIAVFDNDQIALLYMDANPDDPLVIAEDYPPLYSTPTVWYFREGVQALIDALNGCINDLKEEGTFSQILADNRYPIDAIAEPDATPLP